MKISLLATAAVLMAGASAHIEQLKSSLISYYWFKRSDGSTGQWLSFNSTRWQSLLKPDDNEVVIHIISPKQFKSIHPIPENGLSSVPKNSRISDLAVYYDYDTKDNKQYYKPVDRPSLSCIIKPCHNNTSTNVAHL
ncbi:hypothetical protein G6F56_009162 [Rhizopus delemar]|uniref:Uncharacterized protein n=1 Tax=Rhizopus stolonifer TaxID=4846 RepID=A0A367ITG2_RHIST|nr:hypothetical protein G6F56_009162 [Rhizopus delemar]RCH80958.1 hypothetical protein CU098_006937 [Rhizopus stolonifer]